MKINILSGPIQSGKTTFLQQFVQENKCAGILSPVKNDSRYFLNISNSELAKMEAEADESNVYVIGKYRFSISAFDWAENIIKMSMLSSAEYLIIDEIGPLELKDNGFSEILKFILQQNTFSKKVILVIRDTVFDEVIKKFNIDKRHIQMMQY